VGFELTIPASERAKTVYALDNLVIWKEKISQFREKACHVYDIMMIDDTMIKDVALRSVAGDGGVIVVHASHVSVSC
jgi:hypothetical protein